MLVFQYLLSFGGEEIRLLCLKKTFFLKGGYIVMFCRERGCSEGKKCRGLRVAATNVMRTQEFKTFCAAELGSAPNDFLIHECERTGSAITEAAVSL